MAKIAWIGLGNMGVPMVGHLVRAGHDVSGFDISEAAMSRAREVGVRTASSIREACAEAQVVFTMLPKGEHAIDVYTGDDGVFDTAQPGTLLIDSSTIDVESAGRLHEQALKAGFTFIDAPVSGGISGAAAGTLTFMLGGEETAVASAKEYIEPMAGNIFHAGAAGSGQAAKIVNNMMLMISLQGAAEGAVLARKLGLDAQTFWNIAAVSSGESWAMRTWYPVPGVVDTAAANNEFRATFSAMLAHKDVGLAMQAAEISGVDLPAAKTAFNSLEQLLEDGFAERDCSMIIRTIDPEAPGLPE